MSKNKSMDYIIIFLTFILVVFHTFTFLQNYYNFAITLILFGLILLFAFCKSRGVINFRKASHVICLIASVVLIIFIGYFVKGSELFYLVGAYSPYIIWSVLYSITEPLFDNKLKRTFLILFSISFLISAIATLSVVVVDNNASRLLAGAAKYEARTAYYAKGVGGYGFIYGSVFLLYAYILNLQKEKKSFSKFFLLSIIITTSAMIVFASYTTALLFGLIIIFLSIYAQSHRKDATILFILSILAIVILINPILNSIYNIGVTLELDWIINRIGQLIDAEAEGSIDGLKRYKLYMISFNSFIRNPFLGGKYNGGHSFFLDNLAMFGIFGALFCLSFFKYLIVLRKSLGSRIGLIYWMVIALVSINTSDAIVMLPLVLYVLPLMLSYCNKENAI